MSRSQIRFNEGTYGLAPGSNASSSGNVGISRFNHNQAVAAEVARIESRFGSSLHGSVISNQSDPQLRTREGGARGAGRRTLDVYHQTRSYWSGATDTFTEVKTGVTDLAGRVQQQAQFDAQDLAAANSRNALPRGIGTGLRFGGAALGAAGFAVDGYSTYVDVNQQLAAGNNVGAGRSGAEFAGRQAGGLYLGVQGALYGAALGQALIPIPGVGAAIGAVAGGVAGGFGGGLAGGYLAGAGYDGLVSAISGGGGGGGDPISSGARLLGPLSSDPGSAHVSINMYYTPGARQFTGTDGMTYAEPIDTLAPNQYGDSSQFDDVFNAFNGSYADGVFSNGGGFNWSIDTSALGGSSFSSFGYGFGGYDFGGFSSGGFGSGSFQDYGFSYDFGSSYTFDLFGSPVVLDLNGDGVSLTELDESTTFFDMAGDGRKHRTAWAGAGDGVLAFDANGDGKITQRHEVIFTDWDPTAATDMQALLNVFDTNKDGKLGAGDAKIGRFGVLVVDKNGESAFKSLSAAGVASVDLREDQFKQVLGDGSSIDGETSFTKTDGTTGEAATVTLAFDAEGRTVASATSVDAAGATTVTKTLTNPDGSAAGVITAKTSSNGRTRITTIDHDGDRVVDERQKHVTVVAADGVKTRTVTISDAANVVANVTTTTTSADGRTDTIVRDADGNGVAEQREVVTRAADGTKSITVTDLNPNGGYRLSTVHTTSANGQTGTTQSDLDGDRDYDVTRVATVALNATSRKETVVETNLDGSRRSRLITISSLDGASQTVQSDANGDATVETVKTSTIVRNGDGGTTTTETLKGGNGTAISERKTTLSADGLTRTTTDDFNGDGVVDQTVVDVTAVASNGNQSRTVTTTNAAGAKLSMSVTSQNADGVTRTTNIDSDGDGTNDVVSTVRKAADGVVTETTNTYTPNRAALIGKTVVTTSADGLTRTTNVDVNGDGTIDRKTIVTTVTNANGTSTVTSTERDRNDRLLTQTVETVSADGLVSTAKSNLDGVNGFEIATTSTKAIAADKSETTTTATKSANGTLLANSVTKLSLDRNRTDVTQDANGDGKTDLTRTTIRSGVGIVTDTVKTFAENGTLTSSTVTTTSANGLSKTATSDIDGDGAVDETVSDVTVLQDDGGSVRTVTVSGAAGALRSKTVTTTDDVGLSVTEQSDVDGDGTFDYVTTDVTALSANGNRIRTVTEKTASGATLGSVATTATANGLTVVTKIDADGDGDLDLATSDVTALAADGGRTRTVTGKNLDGSVRAQTVTATSADRKTVTVSQNLDGKSGFDTVLTTVLNPGGKVVETEVATEASKTIYNRVRETAADGLSWTETTDANGNGTVDNKRSYAVTINADGSKTEVSKDDNINDNILLGDDGNTANVTTTTSADGLRKDSVITGNNAGFPINHEFHSVKTLNADGSTLETRNSQYKTGGTEYYLSRMKITESADGDSRIVEIDMNGQTVSSSPAFKANIRTETVTAANGVTTETYTQARFTGDTRVVYDRTVTTTSADGQDVTVKRDLDGDNKFDLVKTSVLETNGSRTETIGWYPAGESAGLNDQTVTTTSADGRTKTIRSDYDGDGAFDGKTTQVSTVEANGSTTDVRSDFNANNTLRSRISTTTSANGLIIAGTIDLDGDGVVDENYSNKTVLNDDGGEVATVLTRYADDNSLKNKTVTTTSADGRTVKTEEDFDGDGKIDMLREDSVDAAGDKTSSVTYYKDGVKQSKDVAVVDADGRLTRVTRDFNGDGRTDYVSREGHVADGNGSYDIAASDAWTPHFEANHWFDENGVDHMRVQVEDGDEYQRTLTSAQQSQTLGTLSRIYDVMLDRDTTAAEQQGYIKRANFGLTIDDVLKSDEFKDKYGTLSNAQYVQRLYENAYGRGPKLGELEGWVKYLAGGGSRIDLAYTFAESSLHLTVGNTHAVTNNSRNISGEIARDHTTDRIVAEQSVEALFQATLDRGATAAEVDNWSAKILNGSNTEAQIATSLLGNQFAGKYGSLSNEQFVKQLFQNGLDRAPTTGAGSELALWKQQLDNGSITRADFVVGVAESPDFFAAQGAARQAAGGSTMASNARKSSAGGDQASIARMVQAMSTMTADQGAANSLVVAQADHGQSHQLAAAHG